MIIDLANLGNTAKMVEVSFEPADIDLAGELIMLTGKTRFGGQMERIDSRGRVRGMINADVLFDCTRCLEPIAKHLEIPFEAVFVDASEEDANAEAEVVGELLDESPAENGKIDLAEVVREQMLLAIPEQVFCNSDCKGLCTQCGANLNLIDCKCADDDIDPRWAALEGLK